MHLRRENGCDGPAAEAVINITCPRCSGTKYLDLPGGRGVVECDLCEGAGDIDINRCPASFQDEEIRMFLRAYNVLTKHGTWPVEGGIENQSPAFLEAVSVFDDELAAVNAALQEEQKAKLSGPRR